MSLSRRQFFRGFVGQGPDHQREDQREDQRRAAAIEAHVRTNLLPYDFALTADQTAELLDAVVSLVHVDAGHDLFTPERCNLMREIAEEKIEPWREEYVKAEEVRRRGRVYVAEFLAIEATPGDLERLRERLHVLRPEALEEELERQIRFWLSSLPNARLAVCEDEGVRNLIFSEIRSRC